MIMNLNNLKIEVFSDELYAINSADNVRRYDYIYSSYNSINKEYDRYASKYGIVLKDEEKILKSAILIAGGGGTTIPHERSAAVDKANLVIILGDSVFSIALSDLSINWIVTCENCVTCFEIYSCTDGYIVHGEVSILKISKFGKIEWEFFGRDIFVTPEGIDDFQINDNYAIVKDWDYNVYKIDIINGIELK